MKLRTATTGLAVAVATVIPTAAACGPPPLTCIAAVSNSTPKDYSRVFVYVHSAPYTGLITIAHYKTTNTVRTGATNSTGNGSTYYDISRATPGYRVVVSVAAVHGSQRASCSTSFTPHA